MTPSGPTHDHLAGLHVVQVHRADQVEGAGFGGEDVALAAARDFHFAHRERPEAVRVARHDDAVLRQEDQRERAFELQQRFAQRARKRALRGVRHQVQDDFGVARRLENRAVAPRSLPQFRGVGDVAVVRDRHPALVAGTEKGCALSSTVSPAVE